MEICTGQNTTQFQRQVKLNKKKKKKKKKKKALTKVKRLKNMSGKKVLKTLRV